MSAPLLCVDHLSAGYQYPVVGPLSFRVCAGEVVALTGPNGSGKSTLLSAIIDPGRRFQGHVVLSSPPAFQTQQSRLDQPLPLTGAELLALVGAGVGQVPASLRPLLRRRIDQLSGGQRQLLRVWAALGQSSPLVLLDEPTNNLDPESEALLASILRNQPPERGILLVCHEADFVARVASRTVGVS